MVEDKSYYFSAAFEFEQSFSNVEYILEFWSSATGPITNSKGCKGIYIPSKCFFYNMFSPQVTGTYRVRSPKFIWASVYSLRPRNSFPFPRNFCSYKGGRFCPAKMDDISLLPPGFHLSCVGNGNDAISPEEHFEVSKIQQRFSLVCTVPITIQFCNVEEKSCRGGCCKMTFLKILNFKS